MVLAAQIVKEEERPKTDSPIRRLRVQDYDALVRMGAFDDGAGVELLDGFVVEKMSKNPGHEYSKDELIEWLRDRAPRDCKVRSEGPLALGMSEPEPDVMVVRGANRDFHKRHPNAGEAILVAEVSDSTLERDQQWKQRLYAEAGIPVYLLVNLPVGQIELYSQPTARGYANIAIARKGQNVETPFGPLEADRILPPE